MIRGSFANIRIRNKMVGGKEGGWTVHVPTGEECRLRSVLKIHERRDGPCRDRREGSTEPEVPVTGRPREPLFWAQGAS